MKVIHQFIKETLKTKALAFNNRKATIILISLLGAWIVSFPYEGQLLYTLAKHYGIECNDLLDISLIMLIAGLIIGGIFIRTIKAARSIIIFLIPACIVCTITFFFPSYDIWAITLNLCSVMAGICITAISYYLKNIMPDNRFRTVAIMLIIITVVRTLINNISIYISIQSGIALTIIMLIAVMYLALKMPCIQNKNITVREFDKKTGFKALFLLFLFVAIYAIDFGIMTETVIPKYNSFVWLTSWYVALPYIGILFLIKRLKNNDERSNLLYVAVGMTGFGFVLFYIFDHSISSYLIVNTIMEGAWAIYDIFWWSILAEMLEMVKNSSKILSIGFSALMIGVLTGKIIGDNNIRISSVNLPIVPMAVIFISLIILPILNKLLSKMINKNVREPDVNELKTENFPGGMDVLTEREKEIATLLLKGRTYKLIAAELYLSENTIKTHIKNIYVKLGIKRKSELFNSMMK